VNWFRKGPDGKFVWPGFGENMRVLEWMVGRIEGSSEGSDHAFGTSPRYEDLDWTGLDFSKEQFEHAISIDADAWHQELALHTELFEKLADRLPAALRRSRDALEKRLSA
jgi:phosphoenolpyruvate carboxykinase (GTP)